MELWGAKETCDYLGIGRSRLTQIMRNPALEFPAPLARISAGLIFDAAAVRRWAKVHRPDRAEPDEGP